jgi:hypothetical protein
MTENPQKTKRLTIDDSSNDSASIQGVINSPQGSVVAASSSSEPPSNSSILNASDMPADDLEADYDKLNCTDENYYTPECNKFLLKRELVERNYLDEHPDEDPYLYPSLSDTLFNVKIAKKKITRCLRSKIMHGFSNFNFRLFGEFLG